jgi:hypothetical protein
MTKDNKEDHDQYEQQDNNEVTVITSENRMRYCVLRFYK